jgi:hypothetical protein
MRANFASSANNYFCEKFGIEQDDGQLLDQNFKDFGYERHVFLPNTITMFIFLLSGLCCIFVVFVIDFILKRANIEIFKKLPPMLVSGFIRNIMLFFLELVLCLWLHFIKHEETKNSLASMFFAVITVIVIIFLSLYGIIQICSNRFKFGLFCRTFS